MRHDVGSLLSIEVPPAVVLASSDRGHCNYNSALFGEKKVVEIVGSHFHVNYPLANVLPQVSNGTSTILIGQFFAFIQA